MTLNFDDQIGTYTIKHNSVNLKNLKIVVRFA